VCDATADAWRRSSPERRIDTFGVDIRIADAVEEMVAALFASGGLTGLVNNAAGNFVAPTESLSSRAFDAVAEHRLPRHVLRHAGGRQALGRRGEGGRVDAGAALPQRHEHHRDLGRQRLALRRARRR
jgi:hypothetical protein